MVTLLTGGIGVGKTTRLLEYHRSLPPGTSAGIASQRVPNGYALVDLATSAHRLLAVGRDGDGGPFCRSFDFDRFVFDEDAFVWGEGILDRTLADPHVRHLLLDEIGPIELQGRGFHGLFLRLLEEERSGRKDLVAVVRSECLERVVLAYGIGEPVVLPVRPPER